MKIRFLWIFLNRRKRKGREFPRQSIFSLDQRSYRRWPVTFSINLCFLVEAMFFITEDDSNGQPSYMKLHENPFAFHIEHPGRLETIEDVAKAVNFIWTERVGLVKLGMDSRQFYSNWRTDFIRPYKRVYWYHRLNRKLICRRTENSPFFYR